ncbi:DUF4271 domain-containing protein [Marinilabiliaceae bacterium ANBcel2]|nr:DUF4271 domain-containing protein [Marinilabiliaceae bacterium ANBcel2]
MSSKLNRNDSVNLYLKEGNYPYTDWDWQIFKDDNPKTEYFTEISDEVKDSQRIAIPDSEKKGVDSLITESEPVSKESQLKQDEVPADSWISLTILIAVILVGTARVLSQKYFKTIVQIPLFPNSLNKTSSTNASNFAPSLLANFIFYFNSSVFISQIITLLERDFFNISDIYMVPAIFLFLFTLFTAKKLLYKITGYIFNTSKEINSHLSYVSASNKAFGIYLLPVIILIPFTDHLISELLIRGGILIFIILYLIQLARGISINITNILSGYYIILYLCALEILPLALLYKVLFG